MPKLIDLTGKQFGLWTVLRCAGKNGLGRTVWECRCACGVIKPAVDGSNLRAGTSTSCGCVTVARAIAKNTRHGHGRNRRTGDGCSLTYNSWRGMIARCTNPKDRSFKFYGARGITVCDEWIDFARFLADMGERPSVLHEIDRVKNWLGYSKANCRWVTHIVNGRNTRTNRMIDTPLGPMLLCEAIDVSGLNYGTLVGRLARGWDAARLFDAPRPIVRKTKEK